VNAGREMDALIAEKVMGWTDIHWNYGPPIGKPDDDWNRDFINKKHEACVPNYSSEMNAAMEVVDCLKGEIDGMFKLLYFRHWSFDITPNIADHEGWSAEADTAPHAICLAALKAKGVL
jgi:hypothetical protein